MAMSGPEHYAEAERLLDRAERNKDDPATVSRLQRAQVHATLALVAATVQAGNVNSKNVSDWERNKLRT